MKKNFLFIFSFLIILFVVLGLNLINSNAQTSNDNNSFLQESKSGCLIECTTTKLIISKNEHERLAPASMTKIMTMILVMENIYKNIINYDDVVTTPKEAANLGGSQIYLSEGEKMSVNDLLKGMCISSANDAAMSLAVYIGGTEQNFVNMMNNKANELNLKNTHFVNPYGFDDPNHYSSSYDMALMAAYLINNFPKILDFTSIYEDYVREDTEKRFWLVNTNKLIRFLEGVDGLKTGWTNNSGYCLTATIKKNNERFIAVAMGNPSPTKRNSEITELLNYGVNNYQTKKIISKNEIIKEIDDISFNPNKIIFKASKDVVILKNKGEELKDIKIVENINFDNDAFYIDVYYDNKLYDRVFLVSEEKIQKSSIWNLFVEVIRELFLSTK